MAFLPQSLILLVFSLASRYVVQLGSSVEFEKNNNGSVVPPLMTEGRKLGSGCNLFQGKWVYDNSFPLYESCPYIEPIFDCQKYGRPDKLYLKYSWRPDSCSLPRFNGGELLSRWKGKKIMFVGDSISLNQWTSLLCMIHATVPNAKINRVRQDPLSYVTFPDYDVTIFLYWTPYLVDIVQGSNGRVLNLNSIQQGDAKWKGMDVLVFNSWHWWLHRGDSQPWDYIQDGSITSRDMDRLEAYSKGLSTWANWVDQNIDTSKTKVYFQGISPSHDQNSGSKDCSGEQQPVADPGGSPPQLGVLKKVLSSMKKSVYLLDITMLSQLRKDAHPSAYGEQSKSGPDCIHWCVAGLPDTWNQLLYATYVGA